MTRVNDIVQRYSRNSRWHRGTILFGPIKKITDPAAPRWRHQYYGPVLPGEFEYSELNYPLGHTLLRINWLNILTRLRIWIRRFKTRQVRFDIATSIAENEGFDPPPAEGYYQFPRTGFNSTRANFRKRAREQLDIRNVEEHKIGYVVNTFVDNLKRQISSLTKRQRR